MELKKIIIVIVGLFLFMPVPATPNRPHLVIDEPTERTSSIHNIDLNRNLNFLAQNEPQDPEIGSQTAKKNQDQAPDSETADIEKSGNSANDTETKPITPFKPSEEIAAEQAVDFPVDI